MTIRLGKNSHLLYLMPNTLPIFVVFQHLLWVVLRSSNSSIPSKVPEIFAEINPGYADFSLYRCPNCPYPTDVFPSGTVLATSRGHTSVCPTCGVVSTLLRHVSGHINFSAVFSANWVCFGILYGRCLVAC
jgi:hypothetical protein